MIIIKREPNSISTFSGELTGNVVHELYEFLEGLRSPLKKEGLLNLKDKELNKSPVQPPQILLRNSLTDLFFVLSTSEVSTQVPNLGKR